ncbi:MULTISPECIES: hypothetical protein [Nocardia]|nr:MULTISPECIES: hypothetical protein [Nocardia]
MSPTRAAARQARFGAAEVSIAATRRNIVLARNVFGFDVTVEK